MQFTITDQTAPTIASLAPSTLVAGAATFQLTVTGTNFAPTAKVLWNGSDIPTTFDSATQLTAQVTAAQIAIPGSIAVTVLNDTAAGGTSNVSTFTVTAVPPAPSLVSVSPSSLPAYSISSLAIAGMGFTQSTLVRVNNQVIQSSYVSATQITVGPLQFSTNVGTAQLTVEDPASGNLPSNALALTFTQPIPVVTGLTPASVLAAQPALSLVVSGQYSPRRRWCISTAARDPPH